MKIELRQLVDDLPQEEMEIYVKKHLGIRHYLPIRIEDIYLYILHKEQGEYHATKQISENSLAKAKLKEIETIVEADNRV